MAVRAIACIRYLDTQGDIFHRFSVSGILVGISEGFISEISLIFFGYLRGDAKNP